jgi:hypothetical protein
MVEEHEPADIIGTSGFRVTTRLPPTGCTGLYTGLGTVAENPTRELPVVNPSSG